MLDLSSAYGELALRHRERQTIVESAFYRRFERAKRRSADGRVPYQENAMHGDNNKEEDVSRGPGARVFEERDRPATPRWLRQMLEDAESASLRASFFWRTVAGEQKDGRAVLELGQALEKGEGVPRNRTEAYKVRTQ